MKVPALALVVMTLAEAAHAQAVHPIHPLGGLSFPIGTWSGGDGKVAETVSACSTPSGTPAGGFDLVMMVYAEDGTIRADYVDGAHVIHCRSATIEPGCAVTFDTGAIPGAPAFRLSYRMQKPGSLAPSFSMAPPGRDTFRPVAVGTLQAVR